MDPTALSLAARELRARLSVALGLPATQVLIGHPSATAKDLQREARTVLNLFFHRIEPGVQDANAGPGDPFFVRAYCLITAFAESETDPETQVIVSAGENDLRLIGGVMQALHAEPALRLRNDDGDEIAQLQLLHAPMSLDDINHIWSTQGDAPYRLSVDYELALIPLPLARRVERGPKVGALRLQVERVGAPAGAQKVFGFDVPAVRVDGARPDWAPAIRFVDARGELLFAYSVASEEVPAALALAVAGQPGSRVALTWERWDRASGWRPVTDVAPQTLQVSDSSLGDGVPPSTVHTVDLPIDAPGQALVYATRQWTRADGAVIDLRSNPLLVSVLKAEVH
jgi:hypothetical protein